MNIAYTLFLLYFVYKRSETVETSKNFSALNRNSLQDIQNLLNTVLNEIKNIPTSDMVLNKKKTKLYDKNLKTDNLNNKAYFKEKENHDDNMDNDDWESWTKWSKCSVTCGKGRKIRWRHCLSKNCEAETEMQEKACQLTECPPFGIKLK